MMILHGLKSKILKVCLVNEYYAEIRKKSANQTKKNSRNHCSKKKIQCKKCNLIRQCIVELKGLY